MHFYSGPPMHLRSGVDSLGQARQIGDDKAAVGPLGPASTRTMTRRSTFQLVAA
jgi:hypothetical protein